MSIEETLKGVTVSPFIDVTEPGGEAEGRVTIIPGVPRFAAGERLILFLVRSDEGKWVVSELALGKFRFATDVIGRKVAVRDEDEIVGWEPDGAPHRERRRDAARFVDFIRNEVRHAASSPDYFVDSAPLVKDLTAEPGTTGGFLHASPNGLPAAPTATFTATSYTFVISGSSGGRWKVFPSAVTFFTGTTTEPGAPGGGVTAVQTGIASWDNDCLSNVNYVYGGTDTGGHTAGLSAPDGANTVLFERNLSAYGIAPFSCSGSGYSGTLGIGGITNASGTHVFNGETFATTTEGDVEMNQGIANCTLLFSSGDWNSAVTHELGHTLGFRHSDQNRNQNGACSTDPSLECSSSAIMTAFVTAGLNAALQAWDQHAVDAVYAGGSCTAPPPSKVRGDFNGDGKADIFWRNNISGADALWLMNGTVPTNTPTNTVADLNWVPVAFGDFNGDGRTDVFWRNSSTGANAVWFMNGATVTNVSLTTVSTVWQAVAAGDLNGDGKDDIVWRNSQTGENAVWFMNGSTFTNAALASVTNTSWHIMGSRDFNGDGKADLFWRNVATGENALWLMNGAAQTNVAITTVSLNWSPVGFGDFNGDAVGDVLWRDSSSGANAVWLMNGSTHTSATMQSTPVDWVVGSVGDFNGDGKADIAWRSSSSGADTIWLMSGATVATSGAAPAVTDQSWKMTGPR